MCQCNQGWIVKKTKHGVKRICRNCGFSVIDIPSVKGSFIEDHPEYIAARPKGKHKKNWLKK